MSTKSANIEATLAEKIQAWSPLVAQVYSNKDSHIEGVGILIAPGVFLTCSHVIPNPETANKAHLLFKTQSAEYRVKFDPDILFHSSPSPGNQEISDDTHLDYTVVALSTQNLPTEILKINRKAQSLFAEGVTGPAMRDMSNVSIIHYPARIGKPKKKFIGLGELEFERRNANNLFHRISTKGGSSGAPLFDKEGKLIGIHRGTEGELEEYATAIPIEQIRESLKGFRKQIEEIEISPPMMPKHLYLADPNPEFTKREEELKAIQKHLQKDRKVVLYGPRGVGKSSLAVQFANIHLSDYFLIWTLSAKTPTSLEREYSILGSKLGIKVAKKEVLQDLIHKIHVELNQPNPKPWLLILEDFDPTSEHLKSFEMPQMRFGHLIILSPEKLQKIPSLEIEPLPEDLPPCSPKERIENASAFQDYETAIGEMILLGNRQEKEEELVSFLYEQTCVLLPHLSSDQFKKFHALFLPDLLESSPHLVEKQGDIAAALAIYFKKNSKFAIAVHYWMIAFQLSKIAGLPCSFELSQVLLPLIEERLIQQNLFYKSCEILTAHGDVERLNRLWQLGKELSTFFPQNLFRRLEEQGKKGHLDRLTESNRALFTGSDITKGFVVENAPKQHLQTRWRSFLETFRGAFKDKIDNFSAYQRNLTQTFKEDFFTPLVEDALFFTGLPPCAFDIRAMGSLARNELTPSSDLEYFILIEKKEDLPYFKALATFLEIQFIALGETKPPGDFPNFPAIGNIEEGMHIDIGGNPLKNHSIATPSELADRFFSGNEEHYEPHSLSHTLMRSTSIYSRSDELFRAFEEAIVLKLDEDLDGKTRRERRFDVLKAKRLQDFEDAHRLSNFKTRYIEPLFHFLGDLALLHHIEEANTLEIIEKLRNMGVITQESYLILHQVHFLLYTMRLGKCPQDKRLLSQIERLVINPFYTLIKKGDSFRQINLFRVSFEEATTSEAVTAFVQGLQTFSLSYLLPFFYKELCLNFTASETLRQAFIDAINDPAFQQEVALIPNHKGYRQIERLKREELHESILNILSSGEERSKDGYSVCVRGPSFEKQKFFLKRSVVEEIINTESGDLKKTYQNTNSRVTHSIEHALHFKQAPSNPNKESPFHPGKERAASSLMFRLFGHGTSVGELVEFTVLHPKGNKSYLVHISKTISGTNLADATPEMLQNIDSKNLSDLFLSLPLLLPGDMRPANMILQENRLISVDNDVSWVHPMTKGFVGYDYNLYTILPFFFPNHVLDQSSIDQVLSLRPGPLLVDWLEELAVYNQEVKRDFSKFEDISKGITVRALFEKEMGGQIFSQFVRLQAFLRKAQDGIPALDILKCIISFHEEQTTDIGQKLYERYARGQSQKGTPSDQVKWVTNRDANASMSMTKSQASFYKNLPTSEEKLQDHSPEKLLQEIGNLLTIDFGNFFFQRQDRTARLEKGFEEIPDPSQQETLLKALVHHCYEALNLSHCTVLTDEILSHFLKRSQEKLKSLTLRNCPKLTEKAIPFIANCKHLEELYLSYSGGIRRFSIPQFVGRDLGVNLPHLKTLHLANTSLERLYLDAPQLEYLKINDNPNLKDTDFKVDFMKPIQTGENPIPGGAFGKLKWERYFGDIGVEPPLPPDIFEILNETCPFWPEKKIYETHILVLIPETVNGKPLTLNTLQKLIKSPKRGHETVYGDYNDAIQREIGDISQKSHWVLMTRNALLESRTKTFDMQEKMIANIDHRWGVPQALEAAVGILMHHVETGEQLFSGKPPIFTRCQERVNRNGWWVSIGGFGPNGLFLLISIHTDDYYGIAALRRFPD